MIEKLNEIIISNPTPPARQESIEVMLLPARVQAENRPERHTLTDATTDEIHDFVAKQTHLDAARQEALEEKLKKIQERLQATKTTTTDTGVGI
jgi:predicted esterase YcpF (UPF0227 family)